MDEEIVVRSREELIAGRRALERGEKDKASTHFWNVLDCLDEIEDRKERRGELWLFASHLVKLGFIDLAVMAVREAIELDETLGDRRHLAEDILTLGNANLQLGNTDEAAVNYREAMQIFLDNEEYGNAASACTNLAGIIANQGQMDDAISLLRKSMEYLQIRQHPNTEMITRMTLIQALGSEGCDPQELIDIARVLFERFCDDLQRDHLEVITPHLESAIRR